MSKPLQLALVLPTYNEEECIELVVNEWNNALAELGIEYEMIILNDGSEDNTTKILKRFDDYQTIKVINKANSGHGPTVLEGYKMAVKSAEWVFQVDSDDEMKPKYFKFLWDQRHNYGALFGIRRDRNQSTIRGIISSVSQWTVNLAIGTGVSDVNTPYRLMRADLLEAIIEQIPDYVFAPNVIISGALAKSGVPIFEFPVPHTHRKTGQVSLTNLRLWKAPGKAFIQTLWYRPKLLIRKDSKLAKPGK